MKFLYLNLADLSRPYLDVIHICSLEYLDSQSLVRKLINDINVSTETTGSSIVLWNHVCCYMFSICFISNTTKTKVHHWSLIDVDEQIPSIRPYYKQSPSSYYELYLCYKFNIQLPTSMYQDTFLEDLISSNALMPHEILQTFEIHISTLDFAVPYQNSIHIFIHVHSLPTLLE